MELMPSHIGTTYLSNAFISSTVILFSNSQRISSCNPKSPKGQMAPTQTLAPTPAATFLAHISFALLFPHIKFMFPPFFTPQ